MAFLVIPKCKDLLPTDLQSLVYHIYGILICFRCFVAVYFHQGPGFINICNIFVNLDRILFYEKKHSYCNYLFLTGMWKNIRVMG